MEDHHFFSVNRLVDFGLGIGVAHQMVRMMNEYMQVMDIPGSINQIQSPVASIYYIALDGRPVGPLNDSELSQLIVQKRVNKETLAWMPGMPEWIPMGQIPAILKIIALTPPPIPLDK